MGAAMLRALKSTLTLQQIQSHGYTDRLIISASGTEPRGHETAGMSHCSLYCRAGACLENKTLLTTPDKMLGIGEVKIQLQRGTLLQSDKSVWSSMCQRWERVSLHLRFQNIESTKL